MDKQTQEYFEKLGRVLDPKMAAINNDESTKIAKVFVLACESIVQFCLFMSQNENGKEVLYDMFGEASEIQLERASRLLTFWFLWQRDWTRGLNFIQSEKIRNGLKKYWLFSESEIDNLKQEFDSCAKEPGRETYQLWEKLQGILGNNKWSSVFAFPALSASLKMHWTQLDFWVGDSI